MTVDELKTLFRSGQSAETEEAIGYLVTSLTSFDKDAREHGYELLDEVLREALYRACLNYGSLAGSFTQPLMTVVRRTVEYWATQREFAPR